MLDRIHKIAEIVAAAAIVGSLVFVGMQMLQNNRIAIANAEIDIRNNFAPMNDAIMNAPQIAKFMTMEPTALAELSPEEQLRLTAFLTQLTNQWMSIEVAFDHGLTPEHTFGVVMDDMDRLLTQYPITRPLMRSLHDLYPSLSETKVNTRLDELLLSYGQ